MVPNPTRRNVLQSGSVLATTALAGCSGLLGGGSSDPDAGNDSYGILLLNEMDQTHTVTVKASPLGGSELIFEKTAEIEPGKEKEWEEVFTGDRKQYRVTATLGVDNFYTNQQQNQATVSVGTETAPDIENIIVKVAPYFDTLTVWVNQSAEQP
ncbi:hypothetical protein [Halobacterium zhouii]|uniref:hypothetical protein n=1 Tax=Halobacterium zhouii TaxID=2902624 RepID=UPI001E3CD042|nr:hypothetical protein [Halobacterium zhouii]